MAVALDRLRLERFQVEVSYHAAWTFFGLKGILAEKWAHGPIFGAVGEAGTGQINLTPGPTVDDKRITAVAGIRASGLLAEGDVWTKRGPEIAQDWLADVLELLKPQRTVGIKNDIFGLYPIRNPDTVTKRLVAKYYNESEFQRVIGPAERPAYTALDVFVPLTDTDPSVSYVVGVVGPPHRGMFFNHEDATRDKAWWLGVRLNQFFSKEEGIDEPLETVRSMISAAEKEFQRVVTATVPTLVE